MARKDTLRTRSADTEEQRFIKEALEFFNQASAAENDFRKNAEEDLRFLSGQQWESRVQLDRQNAGRPCLTFNLLPAFVQQVTNELRQNNIAIQIDPIGNAADVDTADVIAGLIRHIEQDSNADQHYDHASWYSVATGLGYLRILPEYESDDTFNQILKITSISDPLVVYFDPHSVEPDGSDANWCFIINDISTEEFERLYPDSELAKKYKDNEHKIVYQNSFNTAKGWYTENTVRVAEYFRKEYTRKTLYHILDNRTGTQDYTMDKPSKEDLASITDENGIVHEPNITILRSRSVDECKIKWCKINGNEILEETEFPGEYIPVIPVKGDEFWVNGKKFLCGLVYHSKDAQRSYNFHSNLQTEIIDLVPKAPYIGALGQFDGKEAIWRDANITNYSYLEYNPVDINGQVLPAPQRNTMEAPIQAVSQTRMQAADDIKRITGIFDASLGANGNEQSGKAILARQQQTHNSNYHYHDNLARTIKHVGRILVKIIPHYYDTPRMIRIVKPDNTSELIAINRYIDSAGIAKNKKHHILTEGNYGVAVETGPAYTTRRQEAVESIMELGSQYPQALPLIADIAVANMDWPGAKEISARLRTAVPQAVLEATGSDDTDPAIKVQALTSQVNQLSTQLQQLNAHAEQVEQQAKVLSDENKLLKTKAQVELLKANNDIAIKGREIELDQRELELEYIVKIKELDLAERELNLKEASVAIHATKEMNNMANDVHDRTIAHIDRVAADDEKDPTRGLDIINEETTTGLDRRTLE